MRVSQADRDYMRRLGEFENDAHAQRLREHLAQDVSERLRRSMALYLQFRGSANPHDRVDDPSPFYERAHRLGLYRP
jgi:hypothetical protein